MGMFFTYWNQLNAPGGTLGKPPPPNETIRIKVVGTWDTVGSVYNGTTKMIDALTMEDNKLPAIVDVALHAPAFHENRTEFEPTLYSGEPGDGQVLKQVWFPGAHSDVGGGYANFELSDSSLAWFVGELQEYLGIDEAFIESSLRKKTKSGPKKLEWGKSAPHDAFSKVACYMRWRIRKTTRSPFLTKDSLIHPSLLESPNNKTLLTIEELKKKHSDGWSPEDHLVKLNAFEERVKSIWLNVSLEEESPMFEDPRELIVRVNAQGQAMFTSSNPIAIAYRMENNIPYSVENDAETIDRIRRAAARSDHYLSLSPTGGAHPFQGSIQMEFHELDRSDKYDDDGNEIMTPRGNNMNVGGEVDIVLEDLTSDGEMRVFGIKITNTSRQDLYAYLVCFDLLSQVIIPSNSRISEANEPNLRSNHSLTWGYGSGSADDRPFAFELGVGVDCDLTVARVFLTTEWVDFSYVSQADPRSVSRGMQVWEDNMIVNKLRRQSWDVVDMAIIQRRPDYPKPEKREPTVVPGADASRPGRSSGQLQRVVLYGSTVLGAGFVLYKYLKHLPFLRASA